MFKKLLILAAVTAGTGHIDAKRTYIAGLDNQSKAIYTSGEFRKYALGAFSFAAASTAGLTGWLYKCPPTTTKEIVVCSGFSALMSAIPGLIWYAHAETPESTYEKTLKAIESVHPLIASVSVHQTDIVQPIKHHFSQYSYPLVSAVETLNSIVKELDLFADMMSNSRIVRTLTTVEYETYAKILPTVETYIEYAVQTVTFLKSHPEYAVEAHAQREETVVLAAQQAAQAQMQSAQAAQQNANANFIHAINSFNK